MRIANVIEEGKLVGPQVRICTVASSLKGRVVTVVVMPKQNSQAFRQLCEVLDVPYLALPLSRITKEWLVAVRYVLFSFVDVLRLAWIIKRDKFDLVHASGGSWQFKAVLAAKLAGKKVLWHLNDTSMPGFIRSIFSRVSRLADGFIFASERSKSYYKPLIKFGKNECVIPAPVNAAKFNPLHQYPGDEELLESWHGKFVIGTVANINPIKGLETFIRAATSFNKTYNEAVFVVIGPVFSRQKRYYDSLQRLCNHSSVSNIMFVGSRSDVRPLLKRFDVYVCSSNAESSPISVWEAMAMAKPIVSTDVGDVPLYVQDGVNGYIVNVGDSDALAERIGRLESDDTMRKEFGDRCRKIAIQEFDVSLCAERHLEAYKALLVH
jgi:glycosyltransferase involved in cell wall biosynthesis